MHIYMSMSKNTTIDGLFPAFVPQFKNRITFVKVSDNHKTESLTRYKIQSCSPNSSHWQKTQYNELGPTASG
jgi:hypothetical protein